MLCSFPPVTPKSHHLDESDSSFYVYVKGEAAPTMNDFHLYVLNLCADWNITIHENSPLLTSDGRGFVMRGHINGYVGSVTFFSACINK